MGIRAVANYTGKRSCHRMPGGGFDSASELILAFNGPKVWYDLSNVATLQQDSAGTIPVAAAGDPIGRVMDISGANNHAVQATAASRPLWQTTFAAFDGVNDSWATPNINFSSTDKLTVVVGMRKLSDAAVGMLMEFGSSVALAGAFNMRAPRGVFPTCDVTASANGSTFAVDILTTSAAPNTAVLTTSINLGAASGAEIISWVNGVVQATSTGDAGTGPFGTLPLNIGRRNNLSTPFNGNVYGLIIIGRLVSTAERQMLEQYMTAKSV